MDISNISLSKLKELLAMIPAEILKRERDEKASALKELAAFAAERGFRLDELMGGISADKKARVPVAVKYKHPQNTELAWTGRGRQPKWVVEFLAAGGNLEQLSV